MFQTRNKLKDLGILGLNRRNGSFVSRYNKRKFYPLADDKIRTKELAQQAGIAVPELYASISSVGELRDVLPILEQRKSFVIKPAHGSGGEGVLVIADVENHIFTRVDGVKLNLEYVEHYLTNVIYGLYSLGAHPDSAMVEYRVQFDPVFEAVTFRGVPDVRIIIFQGVPVMAMVRLPTKESGGRANLHQGAIGVGIKIGSGKTLGGVYKNDVIKEHPDTGASILELDIPHWDKLLDIASRCYELTGLGYLGVDLVLDIDKGPLVLEVNARPGLNIQIANGTGLLPRLKLVEKHISELQRVEDRIAFAKANF